MRRKLYFLRCHYFLQCFPVQRKLCVLGIFFLNIELGICTCAQGEFEINGECCPMYSPGQHVKIHCSKLTKTTCLPCPDSTYSAKPNDRSVCSKCTVCKTVNGLRVKANCTRTSDTVCEPVEGFYCTDEYKGSCRYAVEHTKCTPGQYIKQKGTEASDTICEPGFYSPEGVNCSKWTDCSVE
ncbi:tumor necrosis factor receptor superfamily member 14-like [Tachysurus fulvidraco]|uniref:tumor necrosis factor receptor superfamily member 14-like n=1 Tax=Tachysurus fulvidraco TaxID=1234273 RepID=UPI001FEE6690|nr:tumor necrosis factor receptor superfamily member 14-like [Tachysurus fulvidraco]